MLDSLSPALESIYGWLSKISEWVAQASTSTRVITALQSGSSDLTGFNTSELELALRSVQDALTSNRAEARAHASSYEKFAQLLASEIEYRNGLGSVITPRVTGGSGSTGAATAQAAVESALGSFFKSYASSSASLQTRSIEQAIAQAENLIAELSTASTAQAVKILEDAGFTGSRNSAIGALNEIITSLNGKLDAMTALPQLLDSPTLTDLDKILSDYGKQSNAYQIKVLKEEYNRIAEAYEYASDEEKVYLREILASNEKQRKDLEGEIINGTFLDRITDGLAGVFQNLGFGDEASSTAAGTLMNTFSQNMGEAGEVVERLATNMATMTPVLGAIVTALQYVVEGLAESIKPIFEEFVKYGIEPLRELGRVIGEVIMPILEDIMPLVEESGRVLSGIFNTLGAVIQPIVSFISSLLIPIIQQLTITLEILEPIIKVIGMALMTVSTAFEWAGQWIRHIFATIANWLADIEIFGNHPFGGMRTSDPGAPASYSDMWQANVDKMNSGFEPLSAADSAATGQALSSASYRGATNVTINIYANGPFVGENGMAEFARLIRDEFDQLDYYGVSA